MVRNDGSSNFINFKQQNKRWVYVSVYGSNYTSASTTSTYDYRDWIPELVHGVFGYIYVYSAQTGTIGGVKGMVYGYVNDDYVLQSSHTGYESVASNIGLIGARFEIETYNRYIKVVWGAPWGAAGPTYEGEITLYGFDVPLAQELQ
jgi:hypothetical protein